MTVTYARFQVEFFNLPDYTDEQLHILRDQLQSAMLALHPGATLKYDVNVVLVERGSE